MVFSHSAYVTQYEILQRNLKDWASNQTGQTAEEILNMNDQTEEEFIKADMSQIKILWWTMNFNNIKSPEVKLIYHIACIPYNILFRRKYESNGKKTLIFFITLGF